MQDEPSIGWDPMYEHRLPWESRLFFLYLLIALGLCVIKSFRLGRQLWWLWPRGRGSLQHTADSKKAELLAASALANRQLQLQLAPASSAPQVSGHQLELAESTFLYRWEMCSADVSSIKKLAVLTLLLSGLALSTLTMNLLMVIIQAKVPGIYMLAGNMAEALATFVVGVFVCAMFYVASSMYEGMLARRRASWNYFCARVKSQPPAPTTDKGSVQASS